MSNVDLATEFTNMITAERGFQANSRVITVADTMLETLIAMPGRAAGARRDETSEVQPATPRSSGGAAVEGSAVPTRGLS